MPELKHDFAAGKMNKDLDERIVPNGQYRDAMNVQVRTTTGDTGGEGNAGTVQNLQGNKQVADAIYKTHGYSPTSKNETTFIGSVGNEKNNKAYFLVASPNLGEIMKEIYLNPSIVESSREFIDYIVEVDTGYNDDISTCKPVVVDRYAVIETAKVAIPQDTLPVGDGWFRLIFNTSFIEKLRVGMILQLYNNYANEVLNYTQTDADGNETTIYTGAEIQRIEGNAVYFYDKMNAISLGQGQSLKFVKAEMPERVLDFDNKTVITGINIIDDLLFWTDNRSEPKRINIKRCKSGTPNYKNHTQLKLTDPLDSDVLLSYSGEDGDTNISEQSLSSTINNDLKLEHVTVIRKAPLVPPNIEMDNTSRGGTTKIEEVYYNFATSGVSNQNMAIGTTFTIPTESDITNDTDDNENNDPDNAASIFNNVNYRINDIIRFQENTYDTGSWVTCIIDDIQYASGLDDNDYKVITFRLLTRNQELTPTFYVNNDPDGETIVDGSGTWELTLVEEDPLFELVFGRFCTRYKYEDGEYSSFGPWSEIAFMPGDFDFDHKKGYNLAMTNTMKKLVIKDFIPHQRVRPADMVAVDILYKNTTSPNVYVVKTITKGIDPEWDNFTTNTDNPTLAFGEMEITSEMIRRPLPNNQNLRSWDNVPQTALAQEITANRLVFSNYTQGYDVLEKPNLKQSLKNYATPTLSKPKKSLKSIRDYKIGLVFGDKYGRETPVISPGYLEQKHSDRWGKIDGTIKVPKNFAGWQNTLELQQIWGDDPTSPRRPDNWISYVKYFIKETSNEYYNMVMDRWYPAEDGNIWLSFASADRNKIDEDTYIILKNEHGNDNPVAAKGRYKVIAIKSEAPDFIKQVTSNIGQVVLGTFTSTTDVSDDPNWAEYMWDGNPDPLNVAPNLVNTQTELAISAGKWNDFLEGYKEKGGDLEIRLKGSIGSAFFVSDWRLVTYYHTVDNEDEPDEHGTGALRWDEPFNSNIWELLLETQGGTTPLPQINWYVEFQERVEKSKPEFDGKFFVKIEKDDVLKSAVLQTTASQQTYTIQKTWEISYIDNSEYNPGVIFNDTGYGTDYYENHSKRSTYKWLNSSEMTHVGGNSTTGGSQNINTANVNTYGDYEQFATTIDGDDVNFEMKVFAEPSTQEGFEVALLNIEDAGCDDTSARHLYSAWRGEAGGWSGPNYACGNSGSKGCHPYDAEFMALGCWDGNSEGWAAEYYDGQGLGDSGNLPNFGISGINSNTENDVYNRVHITYRYWHWWNVMASKLYSGGTCSGTDAENYRHGGKVFIDGMRTREARFNGQGPGSTEPGYGTYDGGNSGSYWKPTGIDKGYAVSTNAEPDDFTETLSGHLGRCVFSYTISRNSDSNWQWPTSSTNPVTGFYSTMSTYGTLFRFARDPFQKVYKIITTNDTKLDIEVSNTSQHADFIENNNQPAQDAVGACWWTSPYYEDWTSGANLLGNGYAYYGNNPGTEICEGPAECTARLGWTNQNPKLEINSASSSPTFPTYGGDPVDGINTFVKIGGIKQPNIGDFTQPPSDYTDAVGEGSSCQPCGKVVFAGNHSEYSNSYDGGYYCQRVSLRVEFREFNIETGELVGNGDHGIDTSVWDPRSAICHDGRESMRLNILTETVLAGTTYIPPSDPAIWETEPKEDVGLDIYYEASHAIPIKLNSENTTNFAPYHSRVTKKTWNQNSPGYVDEVIDPSSISSFASNTVDHRVFHIGYTRGSSIVGIESRKRYCTSSSGDCNDIETFYENNATTEDYYLHQNDLNVGDFLVFEHPDGTKTMSRIEAYMEPLVNTTTGEAVVPQDPITLNTDGLGNNQTGYRYNNINHLEERRFQECENATGFYRINSDVWKFPVELGWHNCWSFGNGVESDRIRDDFNAPQVDNGVKVSATLIDYGREIRGSGMIYSGIYNTTSATNKLNEFNMAEKITKDINPRYGTIQALKARDTDVVVFTEDKVLKVLANKDALYNADGNPQMIATDRVLGQVIPFSGDYGISKNPESLVADQFRMYFTDKQRGAVLRLSRDGLTPISNVGMKSWFRDYLRKYDRALGTFDAVNGEYNITLSQGVDRPKTISFNEEAKGWVSFKSFLPQTGVSVGGKFLTAISEDLQKPYLKWGMWQHYFDIYDGNNVINRNTFYGEGSNYHNASSISVLFNEMPEVIKTFRTTNYDGSQAKVSQFISINKTDAAGNTNTYTDGEYYNLKEKDGWWLSTVKTDLYENEENKEGHFVEREGRWYSHIKGGTRDIETDLDEFGVQGLGNTVEDPTTTTETGTVTITFDSDYINNSDD